MFKLPEEVKKGILEYGKSLEGFLEGKISSARFKGIRVPWGDLFSSKAKSLYGKSKNTFWHS